MNDRHSDISAQDANLLYFGRVTNVGPNTGVVAPIGLEEFGLRMLPVAPNADVLKLLREVPHDSIRIMAIPSVTEVHEELANGGFVRSGARTNGGAIFACQST
jgi:hypothetical protein